MAPPNGLLTPGVLVHQEILELCGLPANGPESEEVDGVGPIRPCRRKNVRSASYDLRLGTAYHASDLVQVGASHHVSGLPVSKLVAGENETIRIPPNQVVVVSSLEKVCMSDEMVGHLTLKQDILLQGLIMASQSQIDAGYKGWIYALLYNLTDGEVCLKFDDSILRFELVRLSQKTNRPYDGDYQDAPLAKALARPISSSLEQLRNDVEARGQEVSAARESVDAARVSLEKQVRNTQIAGGIVAFVALAAVILPVLLGFNGDLENTRERVSKLEGQGSIASQQSKLEGEVSSLRDAVESGNRRIARLEGRATP
jgi:deoxycytidine triphosphate deaminase